MKKMTPEELEEFIHRELCGLPVRPAPSTLEARVLAAIEHRARIAWYHKSWSYWPAAVRARPPRGTTLPRCTPARVTTSVP